MLEKKEEIQEPVVRIIAIEVVLLSILSFFVNPIIGFLAIDFATRAYIDPKYSLLSIIAKFIFKTFKLEHKKIALAPKKFAAIIGFAITLFASIFVGISMPVFFVLTSILIIFSFLEGALGFCVGCKLHWLMNKIVK